MTDNEIIKALECCRDDERYDTCEYCLKCPVSNYNLNEETEAVNCVDALLTRAIDLIKRKDAEIERFETVKKHIDMVIHRNCEYPTGESYNKAFQKALARLYDNTNVKAEAYKELAEELKRHCSDIDSDNINEPTVRILWDAEATIDDAVKEMTERSSAEL